MLLSWIHNKMGENFMVVFVLFTLVISIGGSIITSLRNSAVESNGSIFYGEEVITFGLNLFITNTTEAILFIIGLLIFLEIFFLLDKGKPTKNESKFWFTVNKKTEKGAEILFWVLAMQGFIIFSQLLNYAFGGIVGIIQMMGIVVGGIFLIYLYIKLNSLKYKK